MDKSSKSLEDMPEMELLMRSKSGDKDAYRVLVERHERKAFSIAFGVVRSVEDARDVVQESFVKAYFSLKNFEGRSGFYTWLYRIIFNMAIDFKRRSRHGFVEFEDSEKSGMQPLNEAPGVSDPHEVLLARERAEIFDMALSKLSEEHRAVLVLRELDGLSYEEIAKITGISKGTVMSRLHYARKEVLEAIQVIENRAAGNRDKADMLCSVVKAR